MTLSFLPLHVLIPAGTGGVLLLLWLYSITVWLIVH